MKRGTSFGWKRIFRVRAREHCDIIDDPKASTKTWVSAPKLYKYEPGWEIAEWFCVLDEHEAHEAYDDAVRKPAGVAPAK